MALLGCGELRIATDGKTASCIDGENDEIDEITAVQGIQGKGVCVPKMIVVGTDYDTELITFVGPQSTDSVVFRQHIPIRST
ncbi:hypothetical protein Tcan_03967 [Toxocara canis]|uniref:Uncharacterized protein n=1 Tax=Toxocara canis TaxID=6265 RepID=A0A0B2VLP0_TOXCA|nr:hypothetical protein Tcan_03967 [Toxocara canis]